MPENANPLDALDQAMAEVEEPVEGNVDVLPEGDVVTCQVCGTDIDTADGEPITDPELAGADAMPADPGMMMDPMMAEGGGAPPPPL